MYVSAKDSYIYLRKRALRMSPQPRQKALCLSRKILSLRRTAAFLRKRALSTGLSAFGREYGVFLTCIRSGTCIYMSVAGTGAEKKNLENHRLPPNNKPNVNQLLILARHHNYSSGTPRIISDSDWKFGFVSRNLRSPRGCTFPVPPSLPLVLVHNVYVPYSPPELSIESRVFIEN